MKKINDQSHFADKYFEDIDEVCKANNYFSPVLRDMSDFVNFESSRILDVGCGTGVFLEPIIDAGCDQLYGVDGPSEFVGRAKQRGYKDIQLVDDLSSVVLPFEGNVFDLVICKDVFEHLLNPLFTLSEIHRVLKDDGLFVFHVPNHFPLYGRLKFLYTNDIDTFTFFKNESRWKFPHIRFYEHYDSLKVLESSGFRLFKDFSFHFPAVSVLNRFARLNPIVRKLVSKYPNQFASGFTYLLKKNKFKNECN